MLSSSDWYEEWKEEDFDDLDPVKSGGEPGVGVCASSTMDRFIASSVLIESG
jgi:hypothetical protein